MAIYDHQYGELSYYRVFRAWGGKEHQEYVRIKRSKKAAYAKAKEIDARFAKAQKAYELERAMTIDYHVRDDGHIRGLRRIVVKRKGRNPSEVFELRINVPWEEEIKRTTISIGVHGEEKAFQLCVEKICEWYGIKPRSEVAKSMLTCLAAYQPSLLDEEGKEREAQPESAAVAELVIKKAKTELTSITGGLMKGLKRFTA